MAGVHPESLCDFDGRPSVPVSQTLRPYCLSIMIATAT